MSVNIISHTEKTATCEVIKCNSIVLMKFCSVGLIEALKLHYNVYLNLSIKYFLKFLMQFCLIDFFDNINRGTLDGTIRIEPNKTD